MLELLSDALSELRTASVSEDSHTDTPLSAWGSPTCVSDWSTLVVYRIMSEFVFGREIKPELLERHMKTLRARESASHAAAVMYFLPTWIWTVTQTLLKPSIQRELNRVQNYYSRLPVLKSRHKWADDIHSVLLNGKIELDGRSLCPIELWAECGVLVQAGICF